MITDYEFLGPVDVEIVGDPSKTKRYEINSESIYFEKVDNSTCKEVVTGIEFKRTEDDNFYSDVLGLYFNFDKHFEKAVGMIIDNFYRVNIVNYVCTYMKQNLNDIELRSKSEAYMLKEGIQYRR